MGIVSKNLKQRCPTQALKQAKKKNELTKSHNLGQKFVFHRDSQPKNDQSNHKNKTGSRYVFRILFFIPFVYKCDL